MEQENHTNQLMILEKADALAHEVYLKTKTSPEDEFFGISLELRKLALKVPLHILQGMNKKDRKEFKTELKCALEKSAEIKYLIGFCFRLNYLSRSTYRELEKVHAETESLIGRFYDIF